jgi:hypothetical protein
MGYRNASPTSLLTSAKGMFEARSHVGETEVRLAALQQKIEKEREAQKERLMMIGQMAKFGQTMKANWETRSRMREGGQALGLAPDQLPSSINPTEGSGVKGFFGNLLNAFSVGLFGNDLNADYGGRKAWELNTVGAYKDMGMTETGVSLVNEYKTGTANPMDWTTVGSQ